MTSSRFAQALEKLDGLHAQDPRSIEVNEESVPKELWHARQMTRWLAHLNDAPSELLQLAVRAQHLQRWQVSRNEYPEGRKGYLHWRRDQGRRAGETTANVMRECGYSDEDAERTAQMIRKEGLARDPEVQTVEDCACLVFLENYFSDFSRQVEHDHMIRIIQKTWGKMSEAARNQALELPMDDDSRAMVEEALAA